jgi:hypothetical protein
MRSAITDSLGLAFSPQAALSRIAAMSLLSAPLLLQACGPSFEVIQEGDLRFAHCDRLDLDQEVASSHRLTCWREWRRLYVYGQTRDRIDYAQRRISEIVSGAEGPPFELGGAPPGTVVHVTPADSAARGKASALPAARIDTLPATATEPPPAVMPTQSPTGPAVAPAPPPAPERPGDACASSCVDRLDSCREGCTNQPERCPSCEPAYRRCMRTCYR